MRICFLADYTGYADEGLKKIAFYLSEELSKHHRVKCLNIKSIFSPNFWREIKGFHPNIIHHIPGPSIANFILLKIIKSYCRDSKSIMSATYSGFHGTSLLENFVPWLKPDMLLVQSSETEEMFKGLKCRTEFLPNGVDTGKFVPVPSEVKLKLRRKYQLPPQKFIILHVGSIKKGRNIQLLGALQKNNNQVLIIGSTTNPLESDICRSLEAKGCLIWRSYFENINELYALSDCYVFPTADKRYSVELPLSVMEAMSCDLPVISTRYGALTKVFEEGDGLFFAEKGDEFAPLLQRIKAGDIKVKTREKVLPYSWDNIGKRLEQLYDEVTAGWSGR